MKNATLASNSTLFNTFLVSMAKVPSWNGEKRELSKTTSFWPLIKPFSKNYSFLSDIKSNLVPFYPLIDKKRSSDLFMIQMSLRFWRISQLHQQTSKQSSVGCKRGISMQYSFIFDVNIHTLEAIWYSWTPIIASSLSQINWCKNPGNAKKGVLVWKKAVPIAAPGVYT